MIQGLASWTGPVPKAEALNAPNGMVAYLFPFHNFPQFLADQSYRLSIVTLAA